MKDRKTNRPRPTHRENIVIRAARFACKAHKGVLRKYTGRPYIEHPMRVAGRVMRLPDSTEELIAAAYLHDVVEDTEITLDEIEREFGRTVAGYVGWLTNISKKIKPMPPREERKRIDRENIAKAPVEVRKVKLIDRADNVREIPISRDTLDFANLYGRESLALLDALRGTDEALELELVEELRRLKDAVHEFR